MIREERNSISETLEQGKVDAEKVDAEEVEAKDLASALEKDLDHLKVLKIQETKVRRKLKRIIESKKVLLKKLSK
jgi:hypothetical protein